jgi:hypothetical protein
MDWALQCGLVTALLRCMVGSFKIVELQATHKDGAGLLVME